MKTHLEKAIESIRERIDEQEFNYMVCSAMRERAPFSYMYPREADEITDALEEYGDIDDIVEQI